MLKKLPIVGFIACLVIIYLLSSQPATESAGFSKQITVAGTALGEQIGVVSKGTSEDAAHISVLNSRFRQYAHSIAFFALALNLGLSLKLMGLGSLRVLMLTLLICAVFAGLDEYHQTFVPGRGMQWKDFKSDLQGIGLGLVVLMTVFSFGRSRSGV